MPDAFNGPLVQTFVQLFERGSDDGASRRPAPPPPEMASGRMETGILDEHRDGTGNLHMAIAPLRRAAALAGKRTPVPGYWFPGQALENREVGVDCFPGEALANREVGVDRLVRLAEVALAQILIRDIGEFLNDEIGRRGGITHRWPPEVAGHWRVVA